MEDKMLKATLAVIIATLLGYIAVIAFVVFVIVRVLQHFGIF